MDQVVIPREPVHIIKGKYTKQGEKVPCSNRARALKNRAERTLAWDSSAHKHNQGTCHRVHAVYEYNNSSINNSVASNAATALQACLVCLYVHIQIQIIETQDQIRNACFTEESNLQLQALHTTTIYFYICIYIYIYINHHHHHHTTTQFTDPLLLPSVVLFLWLRARTLCFSPIDRILCPCWPAG
jgi:hypothetical protein